MKLFIGHFSSLHCGCSSLSGSESAEPNALRQYVLFNACLYSSEYKHYGLEGMLT